MEYGVIGDIHGHTGILNTRPEPTPRTASGFFVEDLIDRAPEQVCFIDTVPSIIDAATQPKDQR